MCNFIGCWPWSIKGHAHRWHQTTPYHVSRLLFSCPQNYSINHVNFYCIKQIDYIDYKMITHFTTLLHHLKIHFCIRFPSGTLKFFRVKIYLDDLSLTNVNNHTCEIIYFSSDGNITDYFPLNGNGVVDLSIYFLFPFPFFIFILVGAEGRGHAPNT